MSFSSVKFILNCLSTKIILRLDSFINSSQDKTLIRHCFTFLIVLTTFNGQKVKQQKSEKHIKDFKKSSCGGLDVERLSNNRLHSASVNRIPLGSYI